MSLQSCSESFHELYRKRNKWRELPLSHFPISKCANPPYVMQLFSFFTHHMLTFPIVLSCNPCLIPPCFIPTVWYDAMVSVFYALIPLISKQICQFILWAISRGTGIKPTLWRQKDVNVFFFRCGKFNKHAVLVFTYGYYLARWMKVIRWTQQITERLWLRPMKMSLKELISFWLSLLSLELWNGFY